LLSAGSELPVYWSLLAQYGQPNERLEAKTWWTAILLWIAGGVVAVQALVPVFYFFGEMPHR
jgi:hypothetical protein